jgi:hypothetical protein
MRHEKIFKRSDGSKVRITVELHIRDHWHVAEWSFLVHTREKNKRLWWSVIDPYSYELRDLPMAKQKAKIHEECLKHVSIEEVTEVANELWQMLKPSESTFSKNQESKTK